jgi:hypothetical protein
LYVLSDASAKGPIFFLRFNQADEDIIGPNGCGAVYAFGDGLEKRLLLRGRSAFVERDLHHYQIGCVLDPEVAPGEDEIGRMVFRDDLEPVVSGTPIEARAW